MKHRTKLMGLAVSAALLLSGCGVNSPSGTEREKDITSASGTETAPETTTAAAAATTPTTTASTTAEPEPVKVPASITSAGHTDERSLADYYGEVNYTHQIEQHMEEYIRFYNRDDNSDTVDMLYFPLDEAAMHTEERDDGSVLLTIDANAANLKVRRSTNALSDSDNDIADRIKMSMFTDVGKFGSAYEIKYDDPTVIVSPHKVKEGDDYDLTRVFNENCADLTLGYTIDEPVTINAFVCSSEDGLSLLVDPEYMHGLPMLSLRDLYFKFGNTSVTSDSLLFSAATAEGLALDTADYAYAKVTMHDTHVVYSKNHGYSNTCTVSDIEIVKAFSDIAELDITNDTDIMSGKDKDPAMIEVYNALMEKKTLITTGEKRGIYNEQTRGILLLDLDFDGTPEVIVTRFTEEYSSKTSNKKWKRGIISDVYRITDGSLQYIDTLHPVTDTGEALNPMYIGLSALQDGTKAWFMTKLIPSNDDSDSELIYDDDADYLYTLDGDTLTEHPLFTRKTISEPYWDENNGYIDGVYEYYYFDEKIVPNVTMGKDPYLWDEEDAPDDWEYLDWHGIKATFGEWELFGFLRADFANNNIEASYPLLSDWICDSYHAYSATEQYQLTEREIAHSLAYLVDDYYYGRSNGIDHSYWFLGAYAKPVIYLYPEEQTDVSVQLDFTYGGSLTCTYPDYGEGWNVTAMPDGTLYDKNGDEYYCLYWEGDGAADLDMSRGFCVAGKDTAAFLREKLMYIGLTAREANEFIIYWLPRMQDNAYNVITLHTDDYARSVPLTVSPAPDTQIRVFMTYYSSDEPVDIPEQELPHYDRSGFTLVEWGGSPENN